jgi:hypothetical protein
VLVGAAVLAGCDDEPNRTSIGPNNVKELRAFRGYPVYWTGREFERLPLSHAEHERGVPNAQDAVLISYGTCELPDGEGGCTEPIQIDIRPRESRVPRRGKKIRGVPARVESYDGLGNIVLHTGEIELTVNSDSPAQARRVVKALRQLNGEIGPGEDLPPPRK